MRGPAPRQVLSLGVLGNGIATPSLLISIASTRRQAAARRSACATNAPNTLLWQTVLPDAAFFDALFADEMFRRPEFDALRLAALAPRRQLVKYRKANPR